MANEQFFAGVSMGGAASVSMGGAESRAGGGGNSLQRDRRVSWGTSEVDETELEDFPPHGGAEVIVCLRVCECSRVTGD